MWSPLTANVSRSCIASQRFAMKQASRKAFSTHKAAPRKSTSSLLLMAGGTSALVYTLQGQPIRCDYAATAGRPYAEAHHPAYQGPGASVAAARDTSLRVDSSVDIKSLSFGAVAGISTGIFIKKGLKAAGFLLGGAFVMLQYLSSRGLVGVDWRSMANKYDLSVDKFAGAGTGSRLARVTSRLWDFLLAEFPTRGTFVAGVVLGLRLG